MFSVILAFKGKLDGSYEADDYNHFGQTGMFLCDPHFIRSILLK